MNGRGNENGLDLEEIPEPPALAGIPDTQEKLNTYLFNRVEWLTQVARIGHRNQRTIYQAQRARKMPRPVEIKMNWPAGVFGGLTGGGGMFALVHAIIEHFVKG